LLTGDIGHVAELARSNLLAEAEMVPFRPTKFMLASPEPTAEAVWTRMTAGQQGAGPVVSLEDKYDGIRCQLHKVGARVAMYSRDLKEITGTFQEVAEGVRELPTDFVLDGELLAVRGAEILPFAALQRRLGRREEDLFMREEIPVCLIAFDILWLDGKSLVQCPLRERRRALEGIPATLTWRPAPIFEAHSADEIEAAFGAARQRGNEGLMCKRPESLYTPGRQGMAWVKLKKALATLDCVVVGAEFGHGKRSKVLSDYTFAVRDERTGGLAIIGKAYTGLTDSEIQHLTERFMSTAIRQRGRYFDVPPEVVLEIAFDRVQVSERHASGLALRFPRIARIRSDKSVDEIDTVATAWALTGDLGSSGEAKIGG
jgi:DNA ligase-1